MSYPFDDVGGHLVLDVDGTKTLLDTGSPVTFGSQRAWEFLGAPHRLPASCGSMTTEGLSEAVGKRIHVLLGTDLLRECPFEIDWLRRRVTFGSATAGTGHAVHLDNMLGVPFAAAAFSGENLHFAVDTGAVVSFLPRERLAAFPVAGTHHDFYPTLGPFETPVRLAPIVLAGSVIQLAWGELPEVLAPLSSIATGILGTELYRTFLACFDLANGTLWLTDRRNNGGADAGRSRSRTPTAARPQERLSGEQLNQRHRLGARHALFHKDGTFYEKLTRFPGVLCDVEGYVWYESEMAFANDCRLSIRKKVNVPGTLERHPRYRRFSDQSR